MALALAASLLAGCSASVDEVAVTDQPAISRADALPVTPTGPSPVSDAEKPALGAPQPAIAKPDASAKSAAPIEPAPKKPALVDYKPPFPDRVELFVPPKRQGGVRSPDGEDQDAVELLGFVKVDRAKVVLSINGQVTPVAEGDTQLGVEVISIQPPTVVLQRGRQRWSASLEN